MKFLGVFTPKRQLLKTLVGRPECSALFKFSGKRDYHFFLDNLYLLNNAFLMMGL